jgi:4-alpha-glucanotransferase
MCDLADDAAIDDVIVRTYEALSAAPSMILTATLEDAAAAEKRPNMPGTVDEWPNWSIPLPLSVEELKEHPLARRIAAALRREP